MTLDQSTKNDYGVQYNVAGTTIHLPELNETDLAGEPAIRFGIALGIVNDLHAKTREVQADPNFTAQGKDAQLRPHRERVLDQVAVTVEAIESYADHLDKREAALLSVPELHPQNAAEASIDRELRDYWRSLTNEQRMKTLDEIHNGPGHQRLEIALLRSPYAQADHEVRLIRESWDRGKRVDNPAEAMAIEAGRAQVDWGRLAMAHLTTQTLRTAAIGDGALKALIGAGRERAARVFGYDQHQIEAEKLNIKRRTA